MNYYVQVMILVTRNIEESIFLLHTVLMLKIKGFNLVENQQSHNRGDSCVIVIQWGITETRHKIT